MKKNRINTTVLIKVIITKKTFFEFPHKNLKPSLFKIFNDVVKLIEL